MSGESKWICIKAFGNCWCSETIYIDPEHETAKIEHYEVTYWGHHDEYDYEKYEEPISIERALQLVWPDEIAITRIIQNTQKDYSKTLERLALTKNKNDGLCDLLPSER